MILQRKYVDKKKLQYANNIDFSMLLTGSYAHFLGTFQANCFFTSNTVITCVTFL